jgi:tetratricopeptide (TPR) repeat protein
MTLLIEAAPNIPMYYSRRAFAHTLAGDLAAAQADWSEAIRLNPGELHWQFMRGALRANGLARRPGVRPEEARRLWDDGTAEILAVIDRLTLGSVDHWQLNGVVWCAVTDPAAGADRYRTAVRLAEAARPGWKGPVELSTLGLARYREGRYPEAVEALTASERLRRGQPVTLAVLAMAHHRQGDGAKAAQFLEQARRAAQNRYLEEARRGAPLPEFAKTAEVAGLLREAEQTITGGGREAAPPPRLVER